MHSKLQLPPEADTYLVNSSTLMKPESSGPFSQNRVTGLQSEHLNSYAYHVPSGTLFSITLICASSKWFPHSEFPNNILSVSEQA